MTGRGEHTPRLVELRVENLGIIEELAVVLGSGLTAITGETGAGKTLVVEALELLLGGRADATMVRDGAVEARVEGRFCGPSGEETVLTRVVPAVGAPGAAGARSRAYVNGRLATVSELAAAGVLVVDLHGQHTHQSLLAPAEQRATLDRFAGAAATLDAYRAERAALRRIEDALASLGGDAPGRTREVDLLRFQLGEIDAAGIADPDEAARLEAEEVLLGDADAHREALATARRHLDGPGLDAVGAALGALGDRPPFVAYAERLRLAQADLADVAHELRVASEGIETDPGRLEAVRARRRLLRELGRKYGDSPGAVLVFADEARGRLADLEHFEARAAELDEARAAADAGRHAAADALGRIRRRRADALGDAVSAQLSALGMPSARFSVRVEPGAAGDDGADDVTFFLAANPGEPERPLARVASGGELARTMLALRVVLAELDPVPTPTALVFDEVDAGLGGEAGRAVGRALATLGDARQVLCVTHLAQVAAFADAQVVVEKQTRAGRTVANAALVVDGARVGELSRMLAGVGDSRHARRHAEELLADAARARDARARVGVG